MIIKLLLSVLVLSDGYHVMLTVSDSETFKKKCIAYQVSQILRMTCSLYRFLSMQVSNVRNNLQFIKMFDHACHKC